MKRKYPLTLFYKVTYSLYAILGVAFVFLRIKELLFGSIDWLLNILALGWISLGVAFLYDAIFKKLIISESGMEYQAFLQHFVLDWS